MKNYFCITHLIDDIIIHFLTNKVQDPEKMASFMAHASSPTETPHYLLIDDVKETLIKLYLYKKPLSSQRYSSDIHLTLFELLQDQA